MKLATTTEDFGRFLNTYEERIDCICEAGFKYIDLSMYAVEEDDELIFSDNWCDNAKRILDYTEKKVQNLFRHIHQEGIPYSKISLWLKNI